MTAGVGVVAFKEGVGIGVVDGGQLLLPNVISLPARSTMIRTF